MYCHCPVCRRPILALRVLFLPLWKRWDCPDCGSLLGVDRNRRFLGMIPWLVVIVVLVAVVKITRYGMLVAIPTLALTAVVLIPFCRPIVLARGGFRCRGCGYDLKGQAEPKCPECGEAVAADDLDRFRRLVRGDAEAAVARRDVARPVRRWHQVLIIAVILLVTATLAVGIIVHQRRSAPGPIPVAPVSPAPALPTP